MSSDSQPRDAASEADRQQQILLIVLGVVAVLALTIFLWRRHHARTHAARTVAHVTAQAHVTPSVSASSTANAASSAMPARDAHELFELWIRDPEVFVRKAAVRPGPDGKLPTQLPVSVIAELLKSPLPADAKVDIDAIDEHAPLGFVMFDGQAEGGRRSFALGLGVRDEAKAKLALAHAAKLLEAKEEQSEALHIPVYRGSHSGLYLAIVKGELVLAADRGSLELAVPVLSAGAKGAATQEHDFQLRSPSGVLAQIAQHVSVTEEMGGLAQMFNATVLPTVRTLLADAGALEAHLDLHGDTADGLATLPAKVGSALSTMLGTLPTFEPDLLLTAPRDAIDARALRVPTLWLDAAVLAIKASPLPQVPPEAAKQITPEMIATIRGATTDLLSAVEGEALLAQVQDAPPTTNVGATMVRIRLRDDELARKAVHALMGSQLPPGVTVKTITIDGGAGEYLEQPFPVEALPEAFKSAPPASLPPMGVAWVIKHGYLYGVQGTSARARLVRFASDDAADHLGADKTVVDQVHRLPSHVAYAQVQAPMRADTPLPAVYGMKPLAQAVVSALEPTSQALYAHTHADLDIAAMLFGPELASIGITWMPSQVSPSGLGRGGRPGGGGGRVPSGPPRDLPAVVPSSFQLEVPKHHVSP